MTRTQITRRRGVTYIEVLVASGLAVTSLAAMVSMWYFAARMTLQTNNKAIAYVLARQTMENIKETGFTNTAEAPSSAPVVHYYDSGETLRDSNTTLATFRVSTTVVSDIPLAGSNPVQPDPTALRTVTVTVTSYPAGQSLCTLNTYL